ncbi:MAG: stage V sporulation protein AE [Clostridia bacterium]|nr:stage V sporulation protein AE [Clostridia bacterium]
MEIFKSCLFAFITGGFICLIGQVLIDYTKLTPARILVSFVVSGVILTAIGIYEPLVNFAGAGATVPLTGFGYSLAKGVQEAVQQYGLIGALSGGLTATAAGITASALFGVIMALLFRSGDKT